MKEPVQQGGLGDVCITSMFGDQSRSLVLGRQRKQVAETVKVFLSPHLPRRQTFSMETSTHPSQDRILSMRDPRNSSRSLERSRAAAWERSRVFRVNVHVHAPIRHSLVINLVVFQICCQGLETRSMVVRSQQSEGRRLTCSLSGEGDEGVEPFMRARGVSKEQVGVDDDEFFDSEGFHEASPQASSNLLVRSRRLPGRLLAEALSSMRSFLGSRGEAEISDQPRVLAYLETVFNQRYGKGRSGFTDESRDENNRGEYRRAHGGGRPSSRRSSHTEVQGSGNFCYRRHLGTRSPPRADSRGRRWARLGGGEAGHFAAGTPAAQAFGGSQSEIGS